MSLQVRSPSRPSGAAAAVAYFALQIRLFPARPEKVRLSMPPQEIGLPAAPPQTRPSVGAVRSGAGVTPGAQGRIGSCGETLHALTDQQPAALPLAESEGFCRSKLRRLFVRRLDNPEIHAPVLNESNGPATGLFGWHLDTRTRRHAPLIRWSSRGVESPTGRSHPTSLWWRRRRKSAD